MHLHWVHWCLKLGQILTELQMEAFLNKPNFFIEAAYTIIMAGLLETFPAKNSV